MNFAKAGGGLVQEEIHLGGEYATRGSPSSHLQTCKSAQALLGFRSYAFDVDRVGAVVIKRTKHANSVVLVELHHELSLCDGHHQLHSPRTLDFLCKGCGEGTYRSRQRVIKQNSRRLPFLIVAIQ